MIAEFIGTDRSMGFRKGEKYQIRTICKNLMVVGNHGPCYGCKRGRNFVPMRWF